MWDGYTDTILNNIVNHKVRKLFPFQCFSSLWLQGGSFKAEIVIRWWQRAWTLEPACLRSIPAVLANSQLTSLCFFICAIQIRVQMGSLTRVKRVNNILPAQGRCSGADNYYSSPCLHAKSLQSCLMLCNPMDYSPPGSSVHGIL